MKWIFNISEPMDFTHNTYTQLVHALKDHGYPFYRFASRARPHHKHPPGALGAQRKRVDAHKGSQDGTERCEACPFAHALKA